MVAGATYQISAYVMLAAPDSSNPTVSLSTKTADCATSGSYGTIATSAALSSTAWTKVQGTFSYSNLPGPPTTLDLYLQSSSATDSFYVSDVTIGELSPAPLNPSQQDNTGITTHLRGWHDGRMGFALRKLDRCGGQRSGAYRHAQPADHGPRRQLGWAIDQRQQQDVCRLDV